jgi:hypothetical protein
MRRLLQASEDPTWAPYRSFRLLISLQGFKSYSFTRYDDLTQMDIQWFDSLKLGDSKKRHMMMLKGYLRGLKKVTRDALAPFCLDFNDMLQQSIAALRRQAEWQACEEDRSDFQESSLPGDNIDRLRYPHRRRDGKSMQIVRGMSKLCIGDGCTSCEVFVDVAAELGSADKVTV